MKLGETIDTIFFLILYKKNYGTTTNSSKLYQSIISFECMVQDIWSFELLSTLQFDILLYTSCLKYTCNCVLACVQYLQHFVTKHP